MQLLHGLKKGVPCLAFSPDGATLAAGYYDGTVRLWTPATGDCRKLASCGGSPNVAMWTPDGTKVITVSNAGTVAFCQTDGELTTRASEGEFGGGCLSADFATLLVSSHQLIRRWRMTTVQELFAWPAWSPGHLAASPDGTLIAATHPRGPGIKDTIFHVALRDANTGEELHCLTDSNEVYDGIAFSPDGTRLAVLKHQSFWLWELPDRKVIAQHKFKKFNTGLAYSPDGRTVATASNDGTVRFWDGRTGELQKAFDWKIDKALCVAFAPDGLRAAAGGSMGKIVIWDVD